MRGGTRGLLERGVRRESARENARRKVKTRKANNSLLDTSSSSLNSIRAGQKYQAGKRGRKEEEERRRVAGRREEEEERRKMTVKEEERRRLKEEKPACECGPVLERIGATIEKDRVGIISSWCFQLWFDSGGDTEAYRPEQRANGKSVGVV